MDKIIARLLLQSIITFWIFGLFAWSAESKTITFTQNVTHNYKTASTFSNDSESLIERVDAKKSWQATSFTATAHETIVFSVINGQWTHWLNTSPYNNGVGGTYICGRDSCVEPMPTVATGALIGRIGDYLFAIGNGTTITSPQTGVLYLRINDGDSGLGDNDGVLSVQITDSNQRIFLPLVVKESETLHVTPATPTLTPVPTHLPSLITQVDAKKSWQATSFTATAHETIVFSVINGQWTHWLNTIPYNNGVGGTYICGRDSCVEPMPTVATGALIGRIGNELFAIGNGTTIISQQQGVLYLRINDADSGLGDNDGVLSVQITGQGVGIITPDPTILPTNTPVSTPTPRATSIPPVTTTMTKTVFTIAYMDAIPIYDPAELQTQLIDSLKIASTWHGYKNSQGIPALIYQSYEQRVLKLNEVPPHRTDDGTFDYAAVYERFDLCAKIQEGVIDEVWIWESGSGNALEWVVNGPNWSLIWDTNVPNCGRTVATMNLNYQREVALALHSYGHRMEGTFMTWRPCDFYTQTWPWTNWPWDCDGLVSDRFGYVARPFANNDYIGVCGDIHHPPNILDSREYIYDDRTVSQSICNDWDWTGNSPIQNINCEEWGCDQQGYMIWWMQNIPGLGNKTVDRYGNVMPNWWGYLFREEIPTYATFNKRSNLEEEELKHYFFHLYR